MSNEGIGPGSRVLYAANGPAYVQEARRSIETLWRHNPRIEVALVTDDPAWARGLFRDQEERLTVAAHPSPTFSMYDKIEALLIERPERTVFLDTDVQICGDISPLFDVLDEFDVAAAHTWSRPGWDEGPLREVSDAFPEFNTGVICLRDGAQVDAFLEEWRQISREIESFVDHDQAAFRVALYRSKLRVATLPPEYNFRFVYPSAATGMVKILHGRSRNMDRVERVVNRSTDMRVYIPGVGVVPRRVLIEERLRGFLGDRPRLKTAARRAWHVTGMSLAYRTYLRVRRSRQKYLARPLP